VTLQEFMSCPHNLANNRLTRMLSNLTLVGCYDRAAVPDRAERQRILLRSAADNLRRMAFFGLTERQADTQLLFERTFAGIQFRRRFVQLNSTHASREPMSDAELAAVRRLNRLDVALFRFASRLFDARVQWARRQRSADTGSWRVHAAAARNTAADDDNLDSDNYNGDDELEDEDDE